MTGNMPSHVTAVDIEGNTHEVLLKDLRWRPAAYGIVIKNGALLVSKQFGGYDLPGGGVDLGEMPEAAVMREVKEETGIIVKNPKLVALKSNYFVLPHSDKGQFIQSVMIYYTCDFVGGELSIEGFDEWEKEYAGNPMWCPLDKLDDLTIASSNDFRPYVRQLVS